MSHYMRVQKNEEFKVYRRGADGRPEGKTLGSYGTPEKADDQIKTLESAYDHEARRSSRYAAIDFKPTEAMAAEVKRGQQYAEEREMAVKPASEVIAMQIARREPLSPRTVKVMARKMGRVTKADGWDDPQNPTATFVDHLHMGGGAGETWVRSKVEEMSRLDEEAATAAKSMTTGEAGSLGFAVEEDEAMMYSRFKKGDIVSIAAYGTLGRVRGVHPQKSGQLVYSVSLKGDAGFILCAVKDMKLVSSATKRTVDDTRIIYIKLKMLMIKLTSSWEPKITELELRRLLSTTERALSMGLLPMLKKPVVLLLRRNLRALIGEFRRRWPNVKDPKFQRYVQGSVRDMFNLARRIAPV
jgi:hypothetical protein